MASRVGAKRVFGRSLSDFGTLWPAEDALLECSRIGAPTVISETRPEAETKTNRVRAAFVRFLALGGDEQAPVHENGVELQGAWLVGSLNLATTKTPYALYLNYCRIEKIEAIHSELAVLGLDGSCLQAGLDAGGLRCGGGVYLRGGFHALDTVNLVGATIGGDLDCDDATFERPDGLALACSRAKVEGMFLLGSTKIVGEVNLNGMRVSALRDDEGSWEGAQGKLWLDGFTYLRFDGHAPTDARTRIAWLSKQVPEHVGKDFRTQPWEQLTMVLRAMGHSNAARKVAIEKQEQFRAAGKVPRMNWPFHWLYGKLTGYGYEPVRLTVVLLMAWIVASLVYWAAVNPARFGSSTHLLTSSKATPDPVCVAIRARAGDFTPCEPIMPKYQELFAPAYALDVLLPVISLGSKADWKPRLTGDNHEPLYWGWALQFFTWALAFVGWVSGLMLVVVLGGLVKKD